MSLDRIRLTGLAATGHHGVLAHERRDGQTFVADVVLHVDTRPAAAEDRLDLTVHYGELAEDVVAVLAGPPVDLLETVAERIAALALHRPGVAAVDVVVHKPQAPITVPFADVAVEVHRSREHRPVVAAPTLPHGTARSGEVAAGVPFAPVSVADVIVPGLVADDDVPRAEPTEETRQVPVVADRHPEHERDHDPHHGAGHEPDHGREPDRMDAVPEHPADVVLALGSNLGDSEATLRQVLADLLAVPGLELTAVSPLVRTAPVGGPDQGDYLNAVVLARTALSPRALLRACQRIEQEHGRQRLERWGPRTVDIDLVLHGSTVGVTDDLELPHPRAHQRAFVLQPWAHVAPDAVLPGLGGGPVAALAQTAPDRDGIRWMALDWWSEGARR